MYWYKMCVVCTCTGIAYMCKYVTMWLVCASIACMCRYFYRDSGAFHIPPTHTCTYMHMHAHTYTCMHTCNTCTNRRFTNLRKIMKLCLGPSHL